MTKKISVNINNWETEPKIIDTFNKKISLNSLTKWQIERDKEYQRTEDEILRIGRDRTPEEEDRHQRRQKYGTIADVLRMTNYGGKEYADAYEKEFRVIDNFSKWVDSHPNPIFVIHNASFDMKFMSVRKGTTLEKVPVIDTLQIMKLHLVPLLKTLQDQDEESKKILSRLVKTDRHGKEFFSVSQGVLAKAFEVDLDNWHTAIADVEMLMKILYHVVSLLRKWQDIDISVEHGELMHRKSISKIRSKKKGARRYKEIGKPVRYQP